MNDEDCLAHWKANYRFVHTAVNALVAYDSYLFKDGHTFEKRTDCHRFPKRLHSGYMEISGIISERWIRTTVPTFKASCPTIRRPRNMCPTVDLNHQPLVSKTSVSANWTTRAIGGSGWTCTSETLRCLLYRQVALLLTHTPKFFLRCGRK